MGLEIALKRTLRPYPSPPTYQYLPTCCCYYNETLKTYYVRYITPRSRRRRTYIVIVTAVMM